GVTVSASSAAGFIFKTRILRAGGDGVANGGGGSVLEHCRIVQPAARGIVDTAPLGAHNNSYEFNRIVKSGADGFDSSGKAADIQSTTIIKSGANGLVVTSQQALVQHNKVKHAGQDGLHVAGASGTWEFNACTGAAGNGFVLDGSGNTLSLNSGHGSGGFDLLDNNPGA